MARETKIDRFVIEKMTQEQYDELVEKDPTHLYVTPELPASTTNLGPVKVDGVSIVANGEGVISAVGGGSDKPYLSLERNSEYLYTVTFDKLPEDNGEGEIVAGACSSFVRDGKLYRNLDWGYDNTASFRIVAKDFEGMSFVNGLNNENLDDDLIAQLPYRIVDGVNKYGIMVSTHVLYNDWGWVGTGSVPLTRLPYYVLTHVKSMDTIATDLGDILSNLNVPEAMDMLQYLLQVVITDGTTTYVIMPPTTLSGAFVLQDITANPKLTNFRWVADETVVRTNLQNRPTGVERWNLIDENTTLEDLRFTKAYEEPVRLSEFIGLEGTTKDSTDARLTELYTTAHVLYLVRERNGETWQTMHSIVYSPKGIENLFIQEDWGKDFAYATKADVEGIKAAKIIDWRE